MRILLLSLALDLPLRNVVFGVTFRLLVIHYVVVSRHQQTRPFTSRDLSQLSLLHLTLECFTASSEARYWLRIATFAYPTCIRRPRLGGSRRNIAMQFGAEKLEWCGYPTVK